MAARIERALICAWVASIIGCGTPAPRPAPSPITESQLRAALTEGTALPPRPRVDPEGGRLDLTRIPLGDRHAPALRALDLGAVRELDLSETRISPAAARALCAADGIERLERLVIDCANEAMDDPPPFTASALALVECPALRGLTSLSLLMCTTGDPVAEAIARTPWTALRALDLPANGIGPAGATAIAGAGSLRGLARLRLEHNPIGAEGFRALLAGGVLERTEVNVEHCGLGDESGRLLLTVEAVRGLRFLGNPVSEEVADAISTRFGAAVEVERL